MSDIKSIFTSRWKLHGRLIEADYSQLEIVVLAFLSRDQQLISDIRNKVDVHAINAAKLFGSGFTDAQRKLAKRLSFQLQYGSGAANMATKNGITVATAKKFIDAYYSRYPRVKEWQEEVKKEVEKSRKPSDKRTKNGLPAGVGTYVSCTGREYKFYEYDSPYAGKYGHSDTSFSPTETKNYPVQGLATGDIVPLVVGKLYRAIKANPIFDGRLLLINTIHDSILLDCQEELVGRATQLVREVMENAPEYLMEEFGIDFDLPLSVGVKVGYNWAEMKEWK